MRLRVRKGTMENMSSSAERRRNTGRRGEASRTGNTGARKRPPRRSLQGENVRGAPGAAAAHGSGQHEGGKRCRAQDDQHAGKDEDRRREPPAENCHAVPPGVIIGMPWGELIERRPGRISCFAVGGPRMYYMGRKLFHTVAACTDVQAGSPVHPFGRNLFMVRRFASCRWQSARFSCSEQDPPRRSRHRRARLKTPSRCSGPSPPSPNARFLNS